MTDEREAEAPIVVPAGPAGPAGPSGPSTTSAERVRSFLLAKGVPAARIDEAEAEDLLHLLMVDVLVLPGENRYSANELADLAGMEVAQLRRLWRALGLPDVADDDEAAFNDADLDALSTMNGLLLMRMSDEAVAVEMTRVVGASMARIADAEVNATPVLQAQRSSAERAEIFALTADATFPGVAALLEYAWRRHLQAAARQAILWRSGGDEGAGGGLGTVSVAIGFADLVGFTALSQQLGAPALAHVISRFEAVAYDIVGSGGGRVVKMIGDEVMFVVHEPARAVAIGLALADTYANDDMLSDVRVGLACGQVLSREGDFYGPVVNRASRIVGIANPGSVVVSEELHLQLADDPGFAWKTLRARYLKDLGKVKLWVALRPAEPGAPPVERNRLRRRRKAGLLETLDDAARTRIEDAKGHHPAAG